MCTRLMIGILSLLIVLSCRPKPPEDSPDVPVVEPAPSQEAPVAINTLWADQEWVEKASRALRMGKDVGADEDLNKLAHMSKSEVIAQFMRDPLFAETALSFNLYFLGFNSGNIRVGDHYNPQIFDFPQAILSARNAASDGDYFALLAPKVNLTLGPLDEARLPPEIKEGTASMTQAQMRQLLIDRYQDDLKTTLGALQQPGTFDKKAFCDRQKTGLALRQLIERTGISFALGTKLDNSSEWFRDLSTYCNSGSAQPTELTQMLAKIQMRSPKLLALIEALAPEKYRPQSLADVLEVDLADLGLEKDLQYSLSMWLKLPNSSTNYNRKRASYVLKRYFCDDLTPISLALPEEHTSGKHASDPACQSCHYKLDPMAGFFKDRGIVGFDFSSSPFIVFDDQAVTNRATYIEAWKNPEGSKRTFTTGYVRSLADDSANSYGDNIDDLFKILNSAPEVKQCMVRRMFEFFVGRNQMIDGGYLHEVADRFTEEAQENSAAAFQHTVRDLLTSATFAQNDPVSTQCYDFATEDKQSVRLPCQVAYVLERNCATCHSGSAASGGLNLSEWIQLKDGSQSFPHKRNGTQVDRSTTIQAIYDRISSPHKETRMPMDREMSRDDLDQLFQWTNAQLAKQGGK